MLKAQLAFAPAIAALIVPSWIGESARVWFAGKLVGADFTLTACVLALRLGAAVRVLGHYTTRVPQPGGVGLCGALVAAVDGLVLHF